LKKYFITIITVVLSEAQVYVRQKRANKPRRLRNMKLQLNYFVRVIMM